MNDRTNRVPVVGFKSIPSNAIETSCVGFVI
jgi:hypothetical protein